MTGADAESAANDRDRWDARYAGLDEPGRPLAFVVEIEHRLPSSGRALDLAGGPGATALWLAARGLDTTLADVSPRALEIARSAADQRQVALTTTAVDLGTEPLPAGPWDVIVLANYLQRDLFPGLIEALAEGGLLVVLIATKTNLERNPRPSERFLLDRGELASLVDGLMVVSLDEDWFDGRHEARGVFRRDGSAA